MASRRTLMSTELKQLMTISLSQCKRKSDYQKVANTKRYHKMQLASESKAVEKVTSHYEEENDSPESKRPNLRPFSQNCEKVKVNSHGTDI